jgi:methylase of polypeptide subunit release factors
VVLDVISTPSPTSAQLLIRSSLTRLLEKEISKKPYGAVFDVGYQETLDAVNQGGEFRFAGLDLSAPAGVYPPRPGSSSEFFCRNWSAAGLDPAGGKLLELGVGSGALALHAARQGWDVTGTDIDETAVHTAQYNAVRNGLHAEFICSDLFELLDQRFDAILFNQPFIHKPTVGVAERALASANGELTQRFLDQAADYLEPGGRLVFSYSNGSDDHLLDRTDWSFKVAACDYESFGQYWRVLLVARPL